MEKYKVKIDGIEHILTYVCMAHGGYQYNTEGDKTAHNFKNRLNAYRPNAAFQTSGHTYIVIKKL